MMTFDDFLLVELCMFGMILVTCIDGWIDSKRRKRRK